MSFTPYIGVYIARLLIHWRSCMQVRPYSEHALSNVGVKLPAVLVCLSQNRISFFYDNGTEISQILAQ